MTEEIGKVQPLHIGKIVIEAWRNVKGLKMTLFAALFVQALILLGVVFISVIITMMSGHMPKDFLVAINMVFNIVQYLISATLVVGTIMLSVRHIVKQPIRFFYIFRAFRKQTLGKLWALVMIYLVINLGLGQLSMMVLMHPMHGSILMLIAILFGEVLFAYLMAFAFLLVLDQGLTVAETLATVLRQFKQRWVKVMAIFILLFILAVVCMMPMLVGVSYFNQLQALSEPFTSLPWQLQARVAVVGVLNLAYLWILPWFSNMIAIVYRDLFGIKSAATN